MTSCCGFPRGDCTKDKFFTILGWSVILVVGVQIEEDILDDVTVWGVLGIPGASESVAGLQPWAKWDMQFIVAIEPNGEDTHLPEKT
jgi:hypothetical protein